MKVHRPSDEQLAQAGRFAEALHDGTYCADPSPYHADLVRSLVDEVRMLRDGIKRALPSQPGKWSEGAGDPNDPICLLLCQIEFLENRIADLEDERDL